MEITRVKIMGVEYKLYNIQYRNRPFTIGEVKLGNLIDECIENNRYYYPVVEMEDNTIIQIATLDEQIYCFLGEELEKPTEYNIIDNVQEILDEFFTTEKSLKSN